MIGIGVWMAAGAALYAPVLAKLARDWSANETYSHGFLVPGASRAEPGTTMVAACGIVDGGLWTQLRHLSVLPVNLVISSR